MDAWLKSPLDLAYCCSGRFRGFCIKKTEWLRKNTSLIVFVAARADVINELGGADTDSDAKEYKCCNELGVATGE